MSSMPPAPKAAPRLRACTVSRDVQNFDLLIEDMEAEYGELWGDLTFQNAMKFLDQPQARGLEMLAVALDDEDQGTLAHIQAIIQRARGLNIEVLLIAEELSPIVLHRLLRLGAADFVPYPLPEGALHDAIRRLRQPAQDTSRAAVQLQGAAMPSGRMGQVVAVHPLAGGAGASTMAVNLAWEIATHGGGKDTPRVCLLDLDLQTGSVSTYLDLARTEKVYELLSNTSVVDRDFFMNTLQTFNDKLHVMTAAADMLPLDLVSPEDIERVLNLARANFDFVIVDLPGTVVQWTETVLSAADSYFAMIELDMRSAQNALRLIRALKAEELPYQKLRYLLNRAPKFTDLSGKARAKRLAESLDIQIEMMLPDGGAQVTQANDHGLPLAEFAAKNPLLKDIRKLAQTLVASHRNQLAAAAAA
jgi:pilus assembly protein CpaE